MLGRPVALLPGSSHEIFSNPQWLDLCHDQDSHELWVDISLLHDPESKHCVSETYPNGTSTFKMLSWWLHNRNVEKIIFFDLFHAAPRFDADTIDKIKYFQTRRSCAFVTICKLPFVGINNVFHFDYYWNRTKQAYLEKKPSWKQGVAKDYNQWPININPRPYALMSLTGRNSWDLKQHLYKNVKHIAGYHSSPFSTPLPSDSATSDFALLTATPPARKFFDGSYVSAQLESMLAGDNVVISEKTYDHLIQGRIVMNFGPRHYYRTLIQDGWQFPDVPGLEWDDIEDEQSTEHCLDLPNLQRFKSFISNLQMLTADIKNLHEIFIRNLPVFEHNQQRLLTKPYDIFDLTKLDDK